MPERITKTLFAKVDSIFIINRALTALGMAFWSLLAADQSVNLPLVRWLLGLFVLHLVVFYLLSRWKKFSRVWLFQGT
ncbi:MAG TPA: hypothetical protein VFR89_03250, partial [candidate division Zixibacteria bacterium]|nr:hypothetical protein [candidate division Zixibacteria bacterium]